MGGQGNWKEKKEKEGKGWEEKGREVKGTGQAPPQIFCPRTAPGLSILRGS